MKARSNLRPLMDSKRSSCRKLGKAAGVPGSYISLMARGLMIPTNDQLLKICAALNVTYDTIYPDEDLRRVLAE